MTHHRRPRTTRQCWLLTRNIKVLRQDSHQHSAYSCPDCGSTQAWMWSTHNVSVVTDVLRFKTIEGVLPWSGPSRQRRGRPGTCSYRTWRGRHFWSQFHSWGRGAETHTAVGQATSLQEVFKNMTFVFCLLLYGIAFPCWRGPQPNRKAFSP